MDRVEHLMEARVCERLLEAAGKRRAEVEVGKEVRDDSVHMLYLSNSLIKR